MTKKVILVRHGKAQTPDTFTSDIDRVLTKRGIDDGYKIGKRLNEEGIKPDLIITSPAARANHTANILARTLKVNSSEIKINSSLFHCSEDTFLDAILTLPNSINSVLIVAHNPGINDLADDFTNREVDFLPTTGVVVLKFDTDNWSKIPSSKPIFSLILKPKEL